MIRTKFNLTSRQSADSTIRREWDLTLHVFDAMPEDCRQKRTVVPAMMGVDEEMRDWSACMILEHNAIVNRDIMRIVRGLAAETQIRAEIDPKKDVIPPDTAGSEARENFAQSVQKYLHRVSRLQRLRSKTRFDHPLFGQFNAHQWHCMFGFHLSIHRKQLERLLEEHSRLSCGRT